MPIIINEIEVMVEVTPSGSGGAGSTASGTTGTTGSRDEIIRECVEKVMEIINQKNER
jgi:hypothetical protein